jgi:hypothetical protein
MKSTHRVAELLTNFAGLVCVLGWLSLQGVAQSPGASPQPNSAPSSDPTLTQTIRPDGSISSEWTNPDGIRFCHSEFVNLGNGKTRRVSTVYRKDGTVYYQTTYTTNSDGSAVSEFQYPDPTHKTNGTAVTLTFNPDGTVRESSGAKSYEQPAAAQATSATATVPSSPGSAGAATQNSSPVTVTVTPPIQTHNVPTLTTLPPWYTVNFDNSTLTLTPQVPPANAQITDNFTRIIGKHTLKLGFDLSRLGSDKTFLFVNHQSSGNTPETGQGYLSVWPFGTYNSSEGTQSPLPIRSCQ